MAKYNPMTRGRAGKCKRCEEPIKENDTRLWDDTNKSGPICAECGKNDGWIETSAPDRKNNSGGQSQGGAKSNVSAADLKRLEDKLDKLIELLAKDQPGGNAASMFD